MQCIVASLEVMKEELLLTIQVLQSGLIPPKVTWTVTGAGTGDRIINLVSN